MSRALLPREREAFVGLVDSLKTAVRTTERQGFDRQELHPGRDQLLHHLDRALHWAEEMQWIIETELSPKAAA